jgi:hypothetical protein
MSIIVSELQKLIEANADANEEVLAHFCRCLTREIRWPGGDTQSAFYGERLGVPIWHFACAHECDERRQQEVSRQLRCSMLYVTDFRHGMGTLPKMGPVPFMATAGLVVAETNKWL